MKNFVKKIYNERRFRNEDKKMTNKDSHELLLNRIGEKMTSSINDLDLEDIKLSEHHARIIGFNKKFDYLLLKKEAELNPFTNAFEVEDVLAVLVIRFHGFFDFDKSVEHESQSFIKILKEFPEIKKVNHQIKFGYLTFGERVGLNSSVNRWDDTLHCLNTVLNYGEGFCLALSLHHSVGRPFYCCSDDDFNNFILNLTHDDSDLNCQSNNIGYLKLFNAVCGYEKINLPSQELTNSLNSILTDLSEDEIEILSLFYGLKGEQQKSYESIARLLSLSADDVRLIWARALRKLKHPSRFRQLIY